jgi:hypothetical protein
LICGKKKVFVLLLLFGVLIFEGGKVVYREEVLFSRLDMCGYVKHPHSDEVWREYLGGNTTLKNAIRVSTMVNSKNVYIVECVNRYRAHFENLTNDH